MVPTFSLQKVVIQLIAPRPIPSISRNVRLSACLFVLSIRTLNWTIDFQSKSVLLCLGGELAVGGSVAVAVGVGDR